MTPRPVKETPLVVFVALLAAIGCSSAGGASTRRFEKPKGPHVRVLTFNVNYAMPAPDQTLAAIREARADIVCLQEATPAWERFLRPRLRRTYSHIRFRHLAGAGGRAVFSRWPVTETAWVRPKKVWHRGWFLNIQTPIGPLQVLSVHLKPPSAPGGMRSLKSFVAAQHGHLEEIKELFPHLKPSLPTLILGDFNEHDGGFTLQWLQRKGFTDALREFDHKTPTWHWPTRVVPLAARLDHILYSRGLHALEARVIQKGGSDHFPLLGVFERKPQEPKDPQAAKARDPVNR